MPPPLAGLTGVTVRAATNAEPCVAAPETSPADGPTGDERGVALGRGTDPLPVEVGDMLDLWSVDDLTAKGHLVVGTRVLDHDDRTVTVAIRAERLGDVAAALDSATC